MYPSTDTNTNTNTNTTSKSIVFSLQKQNISCYYFDFGIRTAQTMQKNLSSIIFCLLCCMNWYSLGIIHSSPTVVKVYNHMLCLR